VFLQRHENTVMANITAINSRQQTTCENNEKLNLEKLFRSFGWYKYLNNDSRNQLFTD